jgi:hypothetical protein
MKRLVYSPSVNAWVKSDTGVFDLSPYITSCTIDRRINSVSYAQMEFRNPKIVDPKTNKVKFMFTEHTASDGTIRPMFHPMDPIIITMTRLKGRPVQVFTGYLDTSPYVQVYPGVAKLEASCTLKRLQYTYWDPALPFIRQFLKKHGWEIDKGGTALNPNAEGRETNELNDTSIGGLLYSILLDIGGWDPQNIYIQELPGEKIGKLVAELFKDTAKENADSIKEFHKFLYDVIGASAYGSFVNNSVPSNGPNIVDLTQAQQKAINYAKSRRGTIGFAVFNGNNLIAKYNQDNVVKGRSITKAMILVAMTRKYNAFNASQKKLLASMIKDSDNAAASQLFNNVGTSAINKVAQDAGMTNFQIDTSGTIYTLGGSLVTASDLAKFFAKIINLIPSDHQNYSKQLMGSIRGMGKFGVVAIDANAFGKNGWDALDGGICNSGGNVQGKGMAVTIENGMNNDAYNMETCSTIAKYLIDGLKNPTSVTSTAAGSLAPSDIEGLINRAASTYNFDPNIIREVMRAESNFNQNVVSSAGAIGLMQLMPGTAQGLGVNPRDKQQNVMGGTKLLSQLYNQYNRDIPKMLAAYNAGPGRVNDGRWVTFPETRAYVRKICKALNVSSPV